MTARRYAVLAALSAVLFAAAGASAGPGINPQVQQCDGTYLSGSNTHAPYSMPVRVQTQVQDTTGLRVGTARMGTLGIGQVKGVWRFDSATPNVTITDTGCSVDAHCSSGKCWTFSYNYADENKSVNTLLGQCIYNTANCSTVTGFAAYPAGTIGATTPVGLGACPGTPPATGTTTLFPTSASQSPASPLVYASNGVATLNGSQFVLISATSVWNMGGNYSFGAWIKTSAGGTQYIIANDRTYYGGSDVYWGLALNNGKLELLESRDSTPQATASSGPSLNDGAWHYVEAVRNNGVSRKLYADGALIATFNPTISTGPISLVEKFSTYTYTQTPDVAPFIGASVAISTDGIQQGAASGYFTGQIDEVRVTDQVLSDEEVLLEYNGTKHRYSTDGGATYSYAAGSFPSAANGTTALQTYLPGETAAANSAWIFEAQSTDTVTRILPQYSITQDTGKPLAPDATPTPTSTSQISWSWGAPSKICVAPGTPGSGPYYQLADCASGVAVTPANSVFEPTRLISETYAGPANQLECRRLLLTDVWGTSPLATPATAYTLAAVPISLSFASVSTGSFSASWNANGNASYTRFEVTYALDPAFTVSLATRAAKSDNFTATTAGVTGLTPGTTYYVRVRAFSGRDSDFFGGTATAFLTGSVVTIAGAPALSGAPLSNSSVQFSWSAVSGANGYTLFDSSNLSTLYSGPNRSFTISSLGVNTRFDAEVEADMPAPTPATAHGHATVYTLANAPVGLSVTGITFTSATFNWGGNGNPVATSYEVSVASDPAFGVVVATLSATGTSVGVTGLFPGSTYYARVRAYNGQQAATAFAASISFSMVADISISTSAAPATPYTPINGLVGSWQFDEASGTTTADLSGAAADPAAFGCVTAGCASTPTFAAGPPGLGTAASFSGLPGGVVRSLNGSNFAPSGGGSITLEAWVNPQTAAQVSRAGIAAVGLQNAEDIALDVSGGVYRLLVSNGAVEVPVAVATATIVAGQWTHVVGVLDTAHSTATLYLNGKTAAVLNAAPARVASGAPLSVGNRQDTGGTYSYPFYGRVDDVRVFNRALSAVEVQAEYTGGFISSVTASNSGVTVALPPNAFGAPAQIFITADPVNHPIRVSASALAAGLSVPPDGLTLVPNSLIEVVPVVAGVAFTSTLGSSATVSIPYLDANRDNLIDGTNPPLAASKTLMYTLNTTVNRWEPLPSSVDPTNRQTSGMTPHFSVFALFAPVTLGANLVAVTVYPVPWKPGSGGRFDAAGVSFSHLPVTGRIRILTLTGHKVREFAFSGAGAGTAVWDGRSDDGLRAASGVYFARISSDTDGSVVILKFAIER
ncbi:MAG: fibronectin type III domain-containing protein [Elusimicrobia bacterium]|nr:fibronectin type III domain-containing protein [Elusimicrobiota bacterium]